MVENIIWSPQAVYNFNGILAYLLENWTLEIALRYESDVYDLIDTIARNPFIGTKSEKYTGLRKFLITKHSFLIYRILENQLEIVEIFDTRQDPDKMIF